MSIFNKVKSVIKILNKKVKQLNVLKLQENFLEKSLQQTFKKIPEFDYHGGKKSTADEPSVSCLNNNFEVNENNKARTKS